MPRCIYTHTSVRAVDWFPDVGMGLYMARDLAAGQELVDFRACYVRSDKEKLSDGRQLRGTDAAGSYELTATRLYMCNSEDGPDFHIYEEDIEVDQAVAFQAELRTYQNPNCKFCACYNKDGAPRAGLRLTRNVEAGDQLIVENYWD